MTNGFPRNRQPASELLWIARRPPHGLALPPVRLIVARCSVDYSGRLTARLPEALRLIMLKADGSVLVHADAGGYKPLNKGLLPLLRSLCGTP
jgi:hypothetical protein